jgi:hypothetical protein
VLLVRIGVALLAVLALCSLAWWSSGRARRRLRDPGDDLGQSEARSQAYVHKAHDDVGNITGGGAF